jgi:hypothetical protein
MIYTECQRATIAELRAERDSRINLTMDALALRADRDAALTEVERLREGWESAVVDNQRKGIEIARLTAVLAPLLKFWDAIYDEESRDDLYVDDPDVIPMAANAGILEPVENESGLRYVESPAWLAARRP